MKLCRVKVYTDGCILRFTYRGTTCDAVERYIGLFPRANRISVSAK